MTKRAVQQQYERFLDQMGDEILDATEEEFGGGLFGKVAGKGAKTKLNQIEQDMQRQGRVVVDYAADVADGGADPEDYWDRFKQSNPVFQKYSGPRQRELRDDMLEHLERVGDDLAPLVDAGTDDFWEALRDEYTEQEARDLIDRNFSQAQTFKKYRNGIFTSSFVEEKTINIVEQGEESLKQELYGRIDRVYDGS